MRTDYWSSTARRALSCLLIVASACGGGANSAPTSPGGGGTPTAVLTSIGISGSTSSLTTGNTLQLAAAPKDQNGNAIAASLSWTSSNTAVATVSQSGLVTAVAAGTANITATSGGIVGTFAVTVTATPVLTTITVTGSTTSLLVGNTLQLFAAPKDQNGNAIAAAVTWSSANAAVATISASGLITAVGAGSTTLSARSGTVTGNYTVTVTSNTPVLTTITITGPASTVNTGSTLQLTAQGKDQFGANIAATVTWSSLSTAVATVNTSGLVTGVAGGQTTIRATSGTVTGNFALTVATPFPLAATVSMPGLSFSPFQLDVAAGAVVSFEFPALSHNVQFTTTGGGTPASIGILSNTTVNRTFTTVGTFPYVCTLHPGMEGTIIVH